MKRAIRTFAVVASSGMTAKSKIPVFNRRTGVADGAPSIDAVASAALRPPESTKEVKTMTDQKSSQCCSMEKNRLMDELRKCDCSSSYEEFHQCYRDAARESGDRARSCMYA
jgi:hypothetical protein